jgi:hypothetical protein
MLFVLAVVAVALPAAAQDRPTIFITPTPDNFEVYVSAAMSKKQVPADVTTKEDGAIYILRAATPQETKVSTGHKVVSCLFAYCADTADKGNTSVQLVKNDVVVWSYAVNKARGQKNKQAMAEAIAKHLKDDYFSKLPR